MSRDNRDVLSSIQTDVCKHAWKMISDASSSAAGVANRETTAAEQLLRTRLKSKKTVDVGLKRTSRLS